MSPCVIVLMPQDMLIAASTPIEVRVTER